MIKKLLFGFLATLVLATGTLGTAAPVRAATAPYYYVTYNGTYGLLGDAYVRWKCDSSTNRVLGYTWWEDMPIGIVRFVKLYGTYCGKAYLLVDGDQLGAYFTIKVYS